MLNPCIWIYILVGIPVGRSFDWNQYFRPCLQNDPLDFGLVQSYTCFILYSILLYSLLLYSSQLYSGTKLSLFYLYSIIHYFIWLYSILLYSILFNFKRQEDKWENIYTLTETQKIPVKIWTWRFFSLSYLITIFKLNLRKIKLKK